MKKIIAVLCVGTYPIVALFCRETKLPVLLLITSAIVLIYEVLCYLLDNNLRGIIQVPDICIASLFVVFYLLRLLSSMSIVVLSSDMGIWLIVCLLVFAVWRGLGVAKGS